MRRGILFRMIILFAAAVVTIGCRSTPASGVESSSKDLSYAKTVQKLFILADLPSKGWNDYLEFGKRLTAQEACRIHYKAFKENLETLFKKNGIECDCEVLTGLELDDSNYEGRLKSFSPDAYILVDCVAITMQGKLMKQQDYNVSLIDFPSDKRVWRSNVVYRHGAQINGKAMAVKIYNTITLGLKEDGLNVLGIVEPAGAGE